MLQKKFGIPILIVLLAVIGCGLFYGRRIAQQEQMNVSKSVEVEQSTTPKPPPPGETAESGHWHGDVWHTAPHAPIVVPEAEAELPPKPAERTQVQGTPIGTPQFKPQNIEQAARDGKVKFFSKRTPEYLEAIRTWRVWSEKADEIRAKISQASQARFDAMPETDEEIEQYKKDKEWQRKAHEVTEKINEAYRMHREHEEKRPPFPYLQ